MEDISRRKFLKGTAAAGSTVLAAGCNGNGNNTDTPEDDTPTEGDDTPEDTTTDDGEEGTTEEEEESVNRPANYRWDMVPGRNEELRSALGQYVEGSVGGVVEDHPAFEYSTDAERDNHTVDFEALKLYRDSNFDILKQDSQNPMEEWVEAFVNEDLYSEAKSQDFHRTDVNSPEKYSKEEWLNADSVEEALDLGHGLVLTIGDPIEVPEHAAVMREAFKRYHDFDVLAWETPNQGGVTPSGLMYSPEDDKIRSFDHRPSEHTRESTHYHTEVQEWPFITEGDHHHPLLFHTDEWNRGDVDGFADAKDHLMSTVFGIATDEYLGYNDEESAAGILNNVTATTGAAEQLSRTILEYNTIDDEEVTFDNLWELASAPVGQYIEDPSFNGVIDTVESEGEDYEEYFGGGFALYEVEDEEIVNEVRNDQAGEYDNFGQVYDELEEVA
jgi:hypothetical protein